MTSVDGHWPCQNSLPQWRVGLNLQLGCSMLLLAFVWASFEAPVFGQPADNEDDELTSLHARRQYSIVIAKCQVDGASADLKRREGLALLAAGYTEEGRKLIYNLCRESVSTENLVAGMRAAVTDPKASASQIFAIADQLDDAELRDPFLKLILKETDQLFQKRYMVSIGDAREASVTPELKWRSRLPVRLPCKSIRGCLHVNAVIGTEDYWFLIDTGASTSFMRKKFASRLLGTGRSNKVHGFNGDLRVTNECKPPTLLLDGRFALFPPRFALTDFEDDELDGVIGLDALSKLAVTFDYGTNSILLSNERPVEEWWSEVDLLPHYPMGKAHNHIYAARCKVGDATVDLSLDTGFSGDIALPFKMYGIEPDKHFGGVAYTTSKLMLGDGTAGAIVRDSPTRAIGTHVLSRLIVCFDFPRKKLLFRPRALSNAKPEIQWLPSANNIEVPAK